MDVETLIVDELPNDFETLKMVAIFARPLDFPEKFVVRKFAVLRGEIFALRKPLAVTDTLEAARAAIPSYLTPIPRSQDDALALVECWV